MIVYRPVQRNSIAMITAVSERITRAFASGLKKSVATVWFLLRIMIPTSLAVAILGWSGLLAGFAKLLSPLMKGLGLPGEAALVFLSGALLNNYSAIAVMSSLSLSLRHATILAFMCLVAHNLIIETTVMKSAGSSVLKMVVLRIGTAIVGAFILNILLPESMSRTVFSAALEAGTSNFGTMLGAWGRSTILLVTRITFFVFVIMITQELFEEFRIVHLVSRLLAPLMQVFGLPPQASFLWIVVNVVGYAYGAGIIKSEYESGKMKKQEGDLFNHHAAISHSLLEDSILYAAISLPIFWLVVPRLLLAIAVVWIERFRRRYVKKSFRVGTV